MGVLDFSQSLPVPAGREKLSISGLTRTGPEQTFWWVQLSPSPPVPVEMPACRCHCHWEFICLSTEIHSNKNANERKVFDIQTGLWDSSNEWLSAQKHAYQNTGWHEEGRGLMDSQVQARAPENSQVQVSFHFLYASVWKLPM